MIWRIYCIVILCTDSRRLAASCANLSWGKVQKTRRRDYLYIPKHTKSGIRPT